MKALLFAGPLSFGVPVMAEPITVELVQAEQGWQLLRGGQPFFIKGAGGNHDLNALASAGANSVRTWAAEDAKGEDAVSELLDKAHALGMTVTVGIWLGHERHGFDYNDPAQVQNQFERAQRIVARHKDHPALLLWGVGNEMEGFEDGDNPAVWRAVNAIGEMINEVDPHHPTMTVTTFVHGERIEYVHRQMPGIDIHGVNAYGGAKAVHEWLREADATKPYVLTEYGPPGTWEVGKTAWGAPYELTSTQKATAYQDTYENALIAQADMALGGYAFLWGHKMEGTPTWFGLWTAEGERLAAVDTLTALWSGSTPTNLAPVVAPLTIEGDRRFEPGSRLQVKATIRDPDDDRLSSRWELRSDSMELLTGGDFRSTPLRIDSAIVESSLEKATVKLPDAPGPYRLYYTVTDSNGGAATANVPLLVIGEPRLPMPYPVYEDSLEGMSWAPSGWMGNVDALSLDGQSIQSVHAGNHSIRVRYEGPLGWAAIAWQHPANNWGDQDGGFNLTGAGALELWARGQYGGEKIGVGVGLLDDATQFPDSVIERIEDVELSSDWQKITIPLRRKDLSSIKTGFVLTIKGRRTPVTVYLDSIRYVR